MVSACSSYCLFQHWELLPLIFFNINHLNCFVSKESSININDLVCLVNVFSFPTRTILTQKVKEQRAFRIVCSNFNFNFKLFPSLKTNKSYCKLLCFKGLSFYVIGFGRNVIGGISPSLGSLLHICWYFESAPFSYYIPDKPEGYYVLQRKFLLLNIFVQPFVFVHYFQFKKLRISAFGGS